MIERQRRDKLAEQVRQLIGGRITTGQFEASLRPDSTDRGIQVVLEEYVPSLYDTMIWSHRLRGRRAISKEEREFCLRVILFLHSDCEYEWREVPDLGGNEDLAGNESVGPMLWNLLWTFLLIAGACVILFAAFVDARDGSYALLCLVLGLITAILGYRIYRRISGKAAAEKRRLESLPPPETGHADVWPLFRRKGYEAALRQPRLLAGAIHR